MTDEAPKLDLERFALLLDTYGADPARFPDPERTVARDLLARDARASELLEQAIALERALSSVPSPLPSAALRRAVAEIPLRHPRDAREAAALPLRATLGLAFAAAAAIALGVASGTAVDALEASDATAERAPEDDLAELAALAFAAELDEELLP